MYLMKCKHDGDGFGAEGSRSRDDPCKPSDPLWHGAVIKQRGKLREEVRQWWELGDVAGERVEEADGAVLHPQQEEEAVHRIDGAVVAEERDLGADHGPRVGVEEADVPVHGGVAGVKAVALGKHHPAVRVTSRLNSRSYGFKNWNFRF